MWGCGLKWFGVLCFHPQRGVTPYVGVWIEIVKAALHVVKTMSPPMWGCGLK